MRLPLVKLSKDCSFLSSTRLDDDNAIQNAVQKAVIEVLDLEGEGQLQGSPANVRSNGIPYSSSFRLLMQQLRADLLRRLFLMIKNSGLSRIS